MDDILYIFSKWIHILYAGSDNILFFKKMNIYIANFCIFAAIGLVNTQIIPFLNSLGYQLIERGYILAGTAIIAIIGQFLFGYLCDRYQKIKFFFLISYFFLIVSSFAMFIIQKKALYYHICAISIMGGMVKVIMGLNETWMLKLDEENYGKLRAAGALGLTLGSLAAGMIVKYFSYHILLYTFLTLSAAVIVLVKIMEDVVYKDEKRIQFSSLKELLTNKKYLLLVSIFLCIYMAGTADQYVVIDKMLSQKASNTIIGVKWAIQSFMEIPVLLYASLILKRFRPIKLLVLGTIMYAIKFYLYGAVSENWMIIAVSGLQLVTLPVIMLSSKLLIKDITPQKLYNSAQMFAMAVFVGVSGLITPVITAYLCDVFGYNITLYAIAGFLLLPLLLILYYMRIKKVKK